MAKKEINRKADANQSFIIPRYCYDCGKICHHFKFALPFDVFCPDCAAHNHAPVTFPRLDAARKSPNIKKVKIWGEP